MMQPAGYHLAEFNFGTLAYPWDDPRIADFRDNLDRVNRIAMRSSGFVWMLDEDAMDATQNDPDGPLRNRPNTASTLSVWETPAQLWDFVDQTLHVRFMRRGADWFVAGDRGYFVGWWVPVGHRPDVAEGMAMWEALCANGPSDRCFGAAGLRAYAKLTEAGDKPHTAGSDSL